MENNFDIQNLIKLAFDAQKFSYSPYSKFAVGACVLAKSGKTYCGANIENASYPAGICAERVALSTAISKGERDFVALAISCSGNDYPFPCGICRQFLSEFSKDMTVVVAKSQADYKTFLLADLLPACFDKKSLN